MSATKASVVEAENVGVAPKKGFGARLVAHFKKWWWVHLIIFCACVLIITLPVVYVGYPRIAQDAVNDSTLEIKEMIVSDPTPESIQLEQFQIIGTDSPFHPKIYEFDAEVSLSGASTPFGTVVVPAVKSKDGAEVHVEQKLDLTDVDAFGEYNKAVMLNEEFSMNVYGKPGLKQGALPKTTVTYNKTVTMKGLNKLKGFDVPEFHIIYPPKNGIGLNGTAMIPNPTVMTITMGNVTMNLAIAGKPVGTTVLQNLVLKPGKNNVPMVGDVDQAYIISLLMSKKNPYKDGVVPFDITGNSSVYHGKELPYFTTALKANKMAIKLDVGAALGEVGIKFEKS
ncbi:hypothetical protein N7457_005501 [Penicillium paradoxum]|uniref:uncharacterized protein n=1 Tax=Penicillium paradoxum TaxID=176176 RepID=UPI002546EE93|nr:uncharacterized protein N7457_005501 [Penicillium paradoxum]KAJ5780341.1 hypothetical protein N7457_005501 [Penicillium paradoxum]